MLKMIFLVLTVLYVIAASVAVAHINPVIESFPLFLITTFVIALPAALFWTDYLHYGKKQFA